MQDLLNASNVTADGKYMLDAETFSQVYDKVHTLVVNPMSRLSEELVEGVFANYFIEDECYGDTSIMAQGVQVRDRVFRWKDYVSNYLKVLCGESNPLELMVRDIAQYLIVCIKMDKFDATVDAPVFCDDEDVRDEQIRMINTRYNITSDYKWYRMMNEYVLGRVNEAIVNLPLNEKKEITVKAIKQYLNDDIVNEYDDLSILFMHGIVHKDGKPYYTNGKAFGYGSDEYLPF